MTHIDWYEFVGIDNLVVRWCKLCKSVLLLEGTAISAPPFQPSQ